MYVCMYDAHYNVHNVETTSFPFSYLNLLYTLLRILYKYTAHKMNV